MYPFLAVIECNDLGLNIPLQYRNKLHGRCYIKENHVWHQGNTSNEVHDHDIISQINV